MAYHKVLYLKKHKLQICASEGYLYRIKFNGSTVWQLSSMDEYGRITQATIGSNTCSWSFDSNKMLSQIYSSGVMDYDYSFNVNTGNLNSRENDLKNLDESFGYDNTTLNELVSVTGPPNITCTYTSSGNISYKSDAGTFAYNHSSGNPFAVSGITNAQNISSTTQDIDYYSFEKVKKITEGTKTADFWYNADHQRIKMELKTSGSTTKTKYYFGGSCEREVVGSTTTQYIWIGGDAYTAVAIAKKIGTGSWTVYNIFRDHLGTITHLKTGSTINEYSFDAWGRRRDKDTWSYSLSDEPALFAERGFTAHEHLEDFKLINMNGRLYDPVVGRFLSPDPYVQDPTNSQSFNRYSYCLNNPLKYNDPSGDKWDWTILNPFHYLDNIMQWVNDKTPKLRQAMVDAKIPAFGAGYNTNFGQFHYINNSGNIYPGLENKIASGQQGISNQIAGFSGMGRKVGDWLSEHIFLDIEFRMDYGLQASLEGKVLGAGIGAGYQNNTVLIVQLNTGFSDRFYFEEYSSPKYGYGNVLDPIRNSWSGKLGGGASRTYDSRREMFHFGKLESENISLVGININSTFDKNGNVIANKYYWGFGADLSVIVGFSFDINIGYKQLKKNKDGISY